MKRKSFVTLTLLSSLVLVMFGVVFTNLGAASPTIRMFVDPNTSSANVDETFTVNIKVENVVKLYAWQFNLRWNSTLLEVVSAAEGPFLNSSGAYSSYRVIKLNFPTVGQMHAEAVLMGEPAPAAPTGNGTIAYVTLRAKTRGVCVLELFDTYLIDFWGVQLTHRIDDGYFAYPLPKITFDPEAVRNATLLAGTTFSVDINISDVEYAYSWSFNMSWSTGVLNFSSVTEGGFLKDKGATSLVYEANETRGSLYVNCSLTGAPLGGVSGAGVLASVTFTVETVGSTSIDITESVLLQQSKAFIPHKVIGHGYFNNILRDIAITSINVPSSVTAGSDVDVGVVVKNKGTVLESVSVTVNVTGTGYTKSLGTKTYANLAASTSTTLTFTWSTIGVAAGDYTVMAVTNVVPDEEITNDNSGTTTISVSVGGIGLPFEVIIAIVVVVVVVAVVAGFLLLRRGRSKPSTP